MVFDINKKIPLNMGEYDLRRQNIKIKSEVGEVIAKHRVPYLHLRREYKQDYLDQRFPFGFIPLSVKEFIKKYWFSIDAFRFVSENYQFSNIEFYEIKVRNYYPNLRKEAYIPDMTKRELDIYEKAIKAGFIVKVIIIWFYDDWRYDIVIKDFNPRDFKIAEGSKAFLYKMKKFYYKWGSNP